MLSSFPGLTGESMLMKKYNRKWKTDLIEKANLNWKDLYENLITRFPEQLALWIPRLNRGMTKGVVE